MKITIGLLVLALFATTGMCLLTAVEFTSLFKDKCFDKRSQDRKQVVGQTRPQGFTLGSFLDKVDDLQECNTQIDRRIPSLASLLRFRLSTDNYEWSNENQGGSFLIKKNYETRHKILNHYLSDNKNDVDVKTLKISNSSLCSFVFMLSHTVNTTMKATGYDYYSHEHYREQGVLTLFGDDESVVSIGKVLDGLIAVGDSVKNTTLEEIGKKIDQNTPSLNNLENVFTDTLRIVTVGDVVGSPAAIATDDDKDLEKTIGKGGHYFMKSCPISYLLDDQQISPSTKAQIAGAVDGLILGSFYRNNRNQAEKLSLSQLLKAYYSKAGIVLDQSGRRVSFCDRQDVIRSDDQLKTEVENYFKLHRAATGINSPQLNSNTQRAYDAFIQTVGSLNTGKRIREICADSSVSICETPQDILIILDSGSGYTDTQKKEQQMSVLGNITSQLSFASNNMYHVYLPSRRPEGGLKEILHTTSSACAACLLLDGVLEQNANNSIGPETNEIVFKALNETLRDLDNKNNEKHKTGSRGKVVLYVNLIENLPEPSNELRDTLKLLRTNQRETKLFAIGRPDALNKLNSGGYTFQIKSADETVKEAKNIAQDICKAAAALKYPDCKEKKHVKNTREKDSVFEGHVSRQSVQYWAFYPEYFHGSKDLNIKFQGLDSSDTIEVCKENKQACQELSGASIKTYSYKSPCKNGPEKCGPIAFEIYGKGSNSTDLNMKSQHCKEDVFCTSPLQIGFKISHEGMYCAGVFSALFSPFTLLLTAFVVLKNFLH